MITRTYVKSDGIYWDAIRVPDRMAYTLLESDEFKAFMGYSDFEVAWNVEPYVLKIPGDGLRTLYRGSWLLRNPAMPMRVLTSLNIDQVIDPSDTSQTLALIKELYDHDDRIHRIYKLLDQDAEMDVLPERTVSLLEQELEYRRNLYSVLEQSLIDVQKSH